MLDGELETVWIPTNTGGIVARGPDIHGRDVPAIVALHNELGDWEHYPETLSPGGAVWLFDSAAAGARRHRDIDAHDGLLIGKLGKAEYLVELASVRDNDFVRLRKKPTGKRAPKTKLKLPEGEPVPIRTRVWQLGSELSQHALPKPENLWTRIPYGVRVGDRIVGQAGAGKEKVVRVLEADGAARDLCTPQQLKGPSVTPDGTTVFVATHSGSLLEGTIDGETTMTCVFEHAAPLWSTCALDADSVVTCTVDEVLLLRRAPGSGSGAPFDLKQRISGFDLPAFTRLADARFVCVKDEESGSLYALKDGVLQVVEDFPDLTKRGLSVVDGRGFVYEQGVHRELLDLETAWHEL